MNCAGELAQYFCAKCINRSHLNQSRSETVFVAEHGAQVEYPVPMGMHHHPLLNSAYDLNNVEVAKRML
jgi:hypothetical protein